MSNEADGGGGLGEPIIENEADLGKPLVDISLGTVRIKCNKCQLANKESTSEILGITREKQIQPPGADKEGTPTPGMIQIILVCKCSEGHTYLIFVNKQFYPDLGYQ